MPMYVVSFCFPFMYLANHLVVSDYNYTFDQYSLIKQSVTALLESIVVQLLNPQS